MFELSGKRIWVSGHRGMVGSALVRQLAHRDCQVITAVRSELDTRDAGAVGRFIAGERPDAILVAAATVGGIHANHSRPAEFLHDNLAIGSAIIHAAHEASVPKLLYLGSSCVYPRLAPQPMREEALLTGVPEPTNQWYSIAKIAGIKMCDAYRRQYGSDFIAAVPTNLYGPGDNYDPSASHVIPGLIRKMHEAKLAKAEAVTVWGTGTPLRDFMHVDDAAAACVFLLQAYSQEGHINIGTGEEISIGTVAALIREVVGYPGELVFDDTKPDGAARKLLDTSRLHALGWHHRIDLRRGLADAYDWFCQQGQK